MDFLRVSWEVFLAFSPDIANKLMDCAPVED